MKKFSLYIWLLLPVLCACTDTTLISDVQREIEVCLSFNAVQPGSATKASMDITPLESTQVRNLWVMQFDGTAGSSRLLSARYYPDFTPGTKVKLLTSDVENYLLFVANSNDQSVDFSKCLTLDEVKNPRLLILNDTQAAGDYYSDCYNMIMNGHVQTVVNGALLSLDVPMKRNSVRLDVKISNNTASTENPITIDSVGVCSGVAFMHYYTDYELPAKYPAQCNKSAIVYPATAWNSGQADGPARRFTFYCPANKRGSAITSDPKLKFTASPFGTTYLQVYGTDSQGRRVAYRFALGSDLVQDCNLLPNTDYSYDIIISNPGDYVTDSRVENLYMQDFTEAPLANSYMIQPPSVKGVWKSVRIPVRRVYDFWNGTDGYERIPNNALVEGSYGWKAEIIRSTVELVEGVNFKWIKREGADYRDYFEFAIAEGVEGNFVLGVHRYTDMAHTLLDDVFLWSWHMWVTNYNPSATLPLLTPQVDGNGQEARYAYDVEGGQVNRYYGNLWKVGGTLDGRFMMDRNLGELAVDGKGPTDILLYQFGRKDPFPYVSTNYGSLHKFISTYNRYFDESEFPYRTQAQLTESNITDVLAYSIYHPEVYVAYFSNWMMQDMNSEDVYYYTAYNWNDTRLGTLNASNFTAKSIFDPCPAGWRVPPQNSIDFPANTTYSYNIYEYKRVLPNGVVMRYPVTGANNGVAEGLVRYNPNNTWCLWTNRASNGNNGYTLFSTASTNYTQLSNAQAKGVGYPVRCVSYTEP